MYQVIEIEKPASDDNYNDQLMEKIADRQYEVVAECETYEEAGKELLKKQVENAKAQSGLHHEIIEDHDPSPIFVDNFKFFQAIKGNIDSDITAQDLKDFFAERPCISMECFADKAGTTSQYIRMIIKGDRPITDSIISKLKPVMEHYGYKAG